MKVGIVFAGKFSVPNGVSRYVTELACGLAADHEVHLILNDGGFSLPNVWIHSNHLHQHPLFRFHPTLPVVKSLWYVACLTALTVLNAVKNTQTAKTLREEIGLDIIHVQSTDALSADVVTFHACVKAARHKADSFSGSSRIRRLAGTLLFGPYTLAILAIERSMVKHARKIIAVSEILKDQLVTSYGISRERIFVIPLGINTDQFRPDPVRREKIRDSLNIGKEEIVAVFVGHFFEPKGLDFVLDAIQPLSNVRLLVIGNDQNLADYRKRAVAAGLGERVIFTGLLLKGIEEYFAAADIFVLPSRSEGFPLSALEAAACGLPVIVTPVGEMASFVQEGSNGYLIERNAGIIRDRIAYLATHPSVLQEMGLQARKRAIQYSWEIMKEATLAIYREVKAE